MNTKLVNAFKVFSDEECARLSSGLPNAQSLSTDYHSYALERGIDDSWFEMVLNAVKNNNRMKISISSFASLNVYVHGVTSFYTDSMNWSPNELEKKMRVFIPLDGIKDKQFSVSVGSIVEEFIPQRGFCYSWPAWASLSSDKNSNLGLINLDGTIIGRKLS